MLPLLAVTACQSDPPRTGVGQPALGMTPPDRREPQDPPGGRREAGQGREGQDPPPPASGTRLCVTYGAKYFDGDGLGPIPATGARIDVRDGGASVWSGRLGADGCTPGLDVKGAQPYQVDFVADLEVNGNHVLLADQTAKGAGASRISIGSTAFNDGQARTIQVPDSPSCRILAGLTLGFGRENAGVTGKTVQVWRKTDPTATPCPGTSCNVKGELYYMGKDNPPASGRGGGGERGDQTTSVYTMMHELGHKMMTLRTNLDGEGVPRAKDAPGYGKCPGGEEMDGHRRDSVEWNSLALIEGYAHFYATIVLNPGSECHMYSHYSVDWNHDGTKDGFWYRCDGPPVPNLGLAATDYLGTECGPNPKPGTANEYDYQRFLWAVNKDDHVPLSKIMDIIAGADTPTPWNRTWEPSSPANPAARLQAAADARGVGDVWRREATKHGVAR